jgi:ABC-2 type transport system permease protein
MSRARSVWLVARREILERGRSRGFILSMVFTTLLVIGSFALPALLFGDDDDLDIGLLEPAPAGLDAALVATGLAYDESVVVVPVADRSAGEADLAEGALDALLVVPEDLSSSGELVVERTADPTVQAITTTAVVGLRQATFLDEAGIPPAEFATVSTPPETVALDPETEGEAASLLIANLGIVLIFIGIFSFGFTVLTGVVEEKQSRVVEVVLATVRPRDLLMGKVFGIGVLGLVQLASFLIAGAVAAVALGSFELPATTPGAIVQLVIWFFLGYILYATALGFFGSLATRMEEASNASTPITIVATASYLLAFLAVGDDPTGTVARS